MVPDEVNITDFEENTKDLPVVIRKVPYLFFNFLQDYWQNVTINKFHCFSLVEYDKICFLDADSYVINNIDYIFESKTPAIGSYTNDRNEFCISTGIFVIKPNLSFYSLLLNLCITLDFYDDENVFYYLSQERDILVFNSFLNKDFPLLYEQDIVQEQGSRKKFFSQYTYEEIKDINIRRDLLKYIDFSKKF